ncbi:MAG: nucleotidyltransferase domain-containing protein, partial [Parvularculaceae bacterium]
MSADAAVHPEKSAGRPAGQIAEAISAACERQRAGQSYGDAGAALKSIVEQRRRSIVGQYARGDIAAQKLSEVMDEAIDALFQSGARVHAEAAKSLAICGVGGYGRGLLAPYSDIDLLFLHAADETRIRPLLDFILYPMWDAGLKVGHAVHTPSSAIDFAQRDVMARTAYLDRRRIAGPEKLIAD